MRFLRLTRASLLLNLILLSAIVPVSISLSVESATAQSLPTCQPPRANQFLLLVLNQKPDTQAQLRQLLPQNAVLTACDYLSNNVIRVEGFASAEIANAWAKYISDRGGFQAFVARSTSASTIATTPELAAAQPSSSPTAGGSSAATSSSAPTYNPQPLGAGYAILVSYFNRPEVATEVGKITSSTVGLAAYNRHPYLLAMHTTNEATATAMLKTLSDRGLTAVIVDSRRVVLLTPRVATGG